MFHGGFEKNTLHMQRALQKLTFAQLSFYYFLFFRCFFGHTCTKSARKSKVIIFFQTINVRKKSLREILNLLLRISMGKIMKSVDYITCCMPCTSQANVYVFLLHISSSTDKHLTVLSHLFEEMEIREKRKFKRCTNTRNMKLNRHEVFYITGRRNEIKYKRTHKNFHTL